MCKKGYELIKMSAMLRYYRIKQLRSIRVLGEYVHFYVLGDMALPKKKNLSCTQCVAGTEV